MANKEVDLSLDYSLAKIQDSMIGGELQEKEFLNAVKNSRIPDIEEILSNKKDYKNIIDDNGDINIRYLNAVFYVLDGKTGDNYYKFGAYFTYFAEKEKWREMGYENRHDFFQNTPNFPYKESYCSKAELVYRLVAHGRLLHEDLIILGSKITLFSEYMLEDLSDNQFMKIIRQLKKITFTDAQKFIRSGDYKFYLAGEKIPEKKEIPLIQKNEKEFVQVTFDLPKIKIKGRKVIEQKFDNEIQQQVYTIALRELIKEGIIVKKMTDIINRDEYKNYRKKLVK